MRKLYVLFLLLIAAASTRAQSTNDWIDFSSPGKYYVIKIWNTGIHRLDYNTLQNAGVPVASVDPMSFQVFGRGKEQYILVSGESDHSFDPGDYIEFFAEKNDGKADTLLYVNGIDDMSDTEYSLYNDTICYFFTWNASTTNRRMVVDSDTAIHSYTPSDWVWRTSVKRYSHIYYPGELQTGASSSFFTKAEGWYGDVYNGVNNDMVVETVPTPGVYQGPGAPDATAVAAMVSTSDASVYSGTGNHHTLISYANASNIVLDSVYLGYRLIKHPFTFPNANLSSSGSQVYYMTANDQGAATDYQAVSSTTIKYPYNMNLSGTSNFKFQVPFQFSQNKSRLPFQNLPGGTVWVYDYTDTLRKIPLNANGSFGEALIPNHGFGNEAQCYITTDNATINIAAILPVNGTGVFTDFAALNADSAYLILTHSKLMNGAQQYAAYRASAAGGGYETVVVDVEELYYQYGYGIEKHILGIRFFLADMMQEWPSDPAFLFIIGKGLRECTEAYNGTFAGSRKSTGAYAMNLIPSYGFPSSDALISAGLNGSFLQAEFPTGRLAALRNQEVLEYLSKVQQYETQQNPNSVYTIEDKDWQKQIMHFGGGSTLQEQQDFAYFLSTYEYIAEDTLFGGNVQTFLKRSSDPIDPIEYDEVMTRLEDGVSLMTFFGHSSVSGFDQNMDEPENWTNYGKYPVLLGNACYSGDIYLPDTTSASEEFTLIADKGVIAFLSSTKLGFVGSLHLYTTEFYNQFSKYRYGQPLGEIARRTVMAIQPVQLGYYPHENACTQMALHGDPALRLNFHEAPELVIRNQDVFFTPASITLQDDTMQVNVVVSNIGMASSDTILVELRRRFPNGSDSVYYENLIGSYYKDTVVFHIPVQHGIAAGINTFDVLVDIPSFLTEHADEVGNNQVSTTLFIYSNGINTVFPYDYAIVPDSLIDLKASTFNPLISSKPYRFEMDTTDAFNSPWRKFQIVNSAGGVVIADHQNWLAVSGGFSAPFIGEDSVVYYWRVSPDSSAYLWDESSFQYIEGLSGWGQAHFYQFEDNSENNLRYDRNNRGWFWDPNIRRISADVYAFPTNTSEYFGTLWSIDGVLQDYSGCTTWPAVHVAVIDPISLEAWGTYGCDPNVPVSCPSCVMLNSDKQFGNYNSGCSCRNRVEKYFSFRNWVPTEMDSLVSMVENHIPTGHYFILYTWMFADYSVFTPSVYSMLSNIGAGDSIYAGRANEGWIVYGRKGFPAETHVEMGPTSNGFFSMQDTLNGFDYAGSMSSVLIGPASNWQSLYWEQKAVETVPTDTARLSLYGVQSNGVETLLLDTLFTPLDSVINLNSLVDASVYPFVRLRGWFMDTSNFSPAQVQRWQLVYTPAPEAAVSGNLGYYSSMANDTLQEGQTFDLAIAVKNISDQDMDSLLIHYWIEDRNRVRHYLTYPLQDSLRSGEILFDTISIDTYAYPGLNSVWMEVNPVPLNVTTTAYDQLEQYHFNNFAQVPFYVQEDLTNPILDVTFDGVHILNGDIVSGKPHVLVSLNDENPYLIMNEESDTAFFAVYITDPSGQQKRVYFRNGVDVVMQWYPSSGPNGKFKIEYFPEFVLDGTYELLIQASDKSGNASGAIDYRIKFEVINHSTITSVMNYPNPFSTRTHFVFTLTGNELPDYMKIQIMTITGRVVREITMEELGDIRIGKNITEYAWDGTDQFGDQLANGVYLYRVIVRKDGQDVEHRESGADPYFTKGFGKMYLMR